jgi:putative Ca2+/H+ antiporter (TMEM165/GDT1 family)
MARAVVAMIALLSSFVVVALAEMGDKTQLIALILGLRYRRPWIVMTGILIATVCNHALASAVGVWGASRFDERVLGLVLGVSFIAFGLWTLVPDRAAAAAQSHHWGPLVSTTMVFFFAEMGDKTQLATLALGARFGSPVLVTAGTTAGMLVADGVAVFAGSHFGERVPMALFRRLAAALFFVFGIVSLASAVGWL